MAKVGQLFREQREHEKISLRTMACSLDISPMYLSDLERGRRNWSERLINAYKEQLKNNIW